MANPVDDDASPYAFGISVEDSNGSSTLITSASFLPPGGGSVSLSADGKGNFELEPEPSFATQTALDSAFPNGTYDFTIQTTSSPATYSPSLILSGDFPAAPMLSNTEWLALKLQIDPFADYMFSWNGAGSFAIAFEDEDNKVFTDYSQATSSAVPAGTLLPNQDYLARINFGSGNGTLDGSTQLNATYNSVTHFTIHTIPEPSSLLLLVGGAGFYLVHRKIRTNKSSPEYS